MKFWESLRKWKFKESWERKFWKIQNFTMRSFRMAQLHGSFLLELSETNELVAQLCPLSEKRASRVLSLPCLEGGLGCAKGEQIKFPHIEEGAGEGKPQRGVSHRQDSLGAYIFSLEPLLLSSSCPAVSPSPAALCSLLCLSPAAQEESVRREGSPTSPSLSIFILTL